MQPLRFQKKLISSLCLTAVWLAAAPQAQALRVTWTNAESTGPVESEYDQMFVLGDLDLSNLASRQFFNLSLQLPVDEVNPLEPSVPSVWAMAEADNGNSGFYSSNLNSAHSPLFADILTASSSGAVQSENVVTLQYMAIPEPATWGMLVGGAGMLALLRRRVQK